MSNQYKTKLSYEDLKEVYAKYIGIKSSCFYDDSSYEFSKEVNALYVDLRAKKWDAARVSDDLFKEVLSFDVITGQYDFEYIPPAPRCDDSITLEELVARKEKEHYENNPCNAFTFFAVAAVGIALSMSM